MKIAFLIPGLPLNSGGHRNILRAAHWLERFGHDLDLYFVNVDGSSPKALSQAINKNFFPFNGGVHSGADFKPCDILFATQWSTAKTVSESTAAKVKAYFVQDYEPDFYPVSSVRFAAEMSYRRGLVHICHGKWLASKLRSQGYAAESFDYCLAHDVYNPGPRTEFDTRIVLFGRPEMPRRCFELGAITLAEIHKRDPSIKFTIVGSDESKKYDLGFPADNLGHVDGKTAAHIYRNSDLGLAFSTINACGAAYDMMACGLPVQDVGWHGIDEHYGHGDFVLLSQPDPELMAEDALALLSDDKDWTRRSVEGRQFASTLQTEEQMARQIETLILEHV